MDNFTIRPGGKDFWVVRIGQDGSHTPLERFGTKEGAQRRLKALQEQAVMIEATNAKLFRKSAP